MSWFRKKVAPFEGPGRIETVNPVDDPGTTELNWIVPGDYFCQILQAQLDFIGPLIIGTENNYLTLRCTRGGVMIFDNVATYWLMGKNFDKTMTWRPNDSHYTVSSNQINVTQYLHPKCRLYPHDKVTAMFTKRGDPFVISNLSLTLETWRVL